MDNWENLLAKVAFILLVLAGVGPVFGQAGFGATVTLSLVLVFVFYFMGDLLVLPWLIGRIDDRILPAGEGLVSVLIIRYLAPVFGATFGWAGALILGILLGVSEFFLHRWSGAMEARTREPY